MSRRLSVVSHRNQKHWPLDPRPCFRTHVSHPSFLSFAVYVFDILLSSGKQLIKKMLVAMATRLLVLTVVVMLFVSSTAGKPRLREDRILLPIYNSAANTGTSVILIIDGADGACFIWMSSRPQVATVTPIGGSKTGSACSTRAVVTAVSRTHNIRSSIIRAFELASRLVLTATVDVDVIHRIRVVRRTSRSMIPNPCLEEFHVLAYNSQDEQFTDLNGLEFQWFFVQFVPIKHWKDVYASRCAIPIRGSTTGAWRVGNTDYDRLGSVLEWETLTCLSPRVDMYLYPELTVMSGPVFRPWDRPFVVPSTRVKTNFHYWILQPRA